MAITIQTINNLRMSPVGEEGHPPAIAGPKNRTPTAGGEGRRATSWLGGEGVNAAGK